MKYRYKRTTSGILLERKARCTARGDRMVSKVHFDPAHTAAHTADKATIRLLIALSAAHGLPLDQLDIKSAFVHEKYGFKKPVYLRQHLRFDGSMAHPGSKAGILIKNIYGTP